MKRLFVIAGVLSALAGCSENVLDWRNASVSGGKVYEGDSNEPYSGRLTNIPENSIPFSPIFNDLHVTYNRSMETLKAQSQQFIGRNLTCDTHVRKGFIEGETNCRDRSGALRWSGSIYGEGFDGQVKIFDVTGKLALFVTKFDSGLESGVRKIYSPRTHGLVAEYHYKNGKMHGEQNAWSENGTKLLHFTAENGNRTGVLTEWAPNGQKIGEVPYGDVGVNGIVRVWDAETGQLLNETTFVEGEKIGRDQGWRVDGSVMYVQDNRADGTYVNLREDDSNQARMTTTSAPAPASMDTCVDEWIAAYRHESGEDALVHMDQIGEWEDWCSEGIMPE